MVPKVAAAAAAAWRNDAQQLLFLLLIFLLSCLFVLVPIGLNFLPPLLLAFSMQVDQRKQRRDSH